MNLPTNAPPSASNAPRYEFRLFGQSFGHLVDHIEQSHQPVHHSTGRDTYLLAEHNLEYSVKLRNGKLDTKLLQRYEQGLERWAPHLQIDFPLTAALLREFVFPWLGVDLPPLSRFSYTEATLLAEVIPTTGLKVVHVDKARRHYLLYGCQIEIGDLWINDELRVRTLAVEAHQASLVRRTVEALELQDYTNTSYVKGLLALVAPNSTLRKPAVDKPAKPALQPHYEPLVPLALSA